MVLEVQNQPLHVVGDYIARRGGALRFEEEESVYLEKGGETMSRRNGGKLEVKLNLSPPPRGNHPRVGSPSRSVNTSPTSSCVSSEPNQQNENIGYSTSPEATSMMLVGCPRCLMYVMLSEEDPRCPKCKSSVLLDIIDDNNNANTTTTTTTTTKSKKR